MGALKLNRNRPDERDGRRGRKALRLAVFPGGEGLIERVVSLLEAGGLEIVKDGTRAGVVLASDGDVATNVIEVLDGAAKPDLPGASVRPISLSLVDAEAAHIRRVLELCNGNRTKAATALGVARSTLIRKLHEIEVRDKHRGSDGADGR